MQLSFGSVGRAAAAAICVAIAPGCAETVLGAHVVKAAARTAESARRPSALAAAEARPGAFAATGLAIWDGAETRAGVWIAHPKALRAQHARIRETRSGREVEGALLPRDDEAPGPSIIMSADAARALGVAPGEPASVFIAAAAPRIAAEEGAGEEGAGGVRLSALRPAPPEEEGASPAPPRIAPRFAPPPPRSRAPAPRPAPGARAAGGDAGRSAPEPLPRPAAGAYLQVGAFRLGANAAGLVERLRARGQPARRLPRSAGAEEFDIVLIGPLADERLPAARAAAEAEGLADAIEVKP